MCLDSDALDEVYSSESACVSVSPNVITSQHPIPLLSRSAVEEVYITVIRGIGVEKVAMVCRGVMWNRENRVEGEVMVCRGVRRGSGAWRR